MEIATANPIHANNPHYVVLDAKQPGASFVNSGFDGIVLRKGDKYTLSLFVRAIGKGGKVKVCLKDEQGKEIVSRIIKVASEKWKKEEVTLTAGSSAGKATLEVCPQEAGKYALDMISLFPQNTFKGRKNGLRADLAQTLADLHPRFMRFPGGCVAHGNGLDNIYRWKTQ